MLALIACSALALAGDPAADYAEARRQAGPTPEAQVRLALWCESRGLPAERLRHLAMAVMADPANAAARGLMGLVEHEGRWRKPEAVAEEARADPDLAEYDRRRQAAAYTADAQYDLGAWCEEHGLKDQARAHLTAAVRLDPTRELAWKKLGYRRREGRWATDAQLAAEKADAEAQKAADRRWRPALEKWRAMLARPSRRGEAAEALLSVTDPRAVPMIAQVFLGADPATAARLLGQVDSPASSKHLAALAVSAKSAEDRRAAVEILRRRDPREFAGMLIGRFAEPIAFEVDPVAGPGSAGALSVQGGRADVRRLYSPPAASTIAPAPGDTPTFDADGFAVIERPLLDRGVVAAMERQRLLALAQNPTNFGPLLDNFQAGAAQAKVQIPVGRIKAEADRAAGSARDQLARDVEALERHNRAVLDSNARIARALNDITGQSLAAEAKPWRAWYVDQLGFRARAITAGPAERPTIVEDVPLDDVPQEVPVTVATPGVAPLGPWGAGQVHWMSRITSSFNDFKILFHSCFAAGTEVRTIDGPRPIESLKVGDRVLTQDVATGALGYRPILTVYQNPPSPTYRIKLGGAPIVASPFHRFWVAGKGWVMARDLKPGDPVRTLGAVRAVESVEPDKVQPVYNLDVSEDADFFAGKAAALVHDNTLPDPRLAPFDAVAASRPAADR